MTPDLPIDAVFQMPPIDRAAFPDDETYRKAVESSQSARDYATPEGEVDITGLDKVELVRRLYEGTRPLGMGFLQATDDPLTREEAEEALSWGHIDYLKGRPLKVRLNKDTADTRLYNRDAGRGKMEAIVAEMRAEAAR